MPLDCAFRSLAVNIIIFFTKFIFFGKNIRHHPIMQHPIYLNWQLPSKQAETLQKLHVDEKTRLFKNNPRMLLDCAFGSLAVL